MTTWLLRPSSVDPLPTDRQLRGMAVDDGLRGSGIGAVLLTAGVQRAFDDGATAVWANARDTALTFYGRHGFTVVGDGFVDPTTGVPHHQIRFCPAEPARSGRT